MAKNKKVEKDLEVVTPDKPVNQKTTKSKQAPKKKVKGPSKVATKTKETISELKKVSWPSFKTVAKNTGIVLAVVVVCTLVLFGVDQLLALLYGLLPA